MKRPCSRFTLVGSVGQRDANISRIRRHVTVRLAPSNEDDSPDVRVVASHPVDQSRRRTTDPPSGCRSEPPTTNRPTPQPHESVCLWRWERQRAVPVHQRHRARRWSFPVLQLPRTESRNTAAPDSRPPRLLHTNSLPHQNHILPHENGRFRILPLGGSSFHFNISPCVVTVA